MKVLLTGATGMLGKALQRRVGEIAPDIKLCFYTRKEYDLTKQDQVESLFKNNQFDAVIHSAAKVGGIQANINDPITFLTDNLVINTNVITSAFKHGVDRLIFVGSSCMYPKDYTNPLKEEYLLQAPLEPTNEGYALSKIVGAKLCEYISNTQKKYYRTIIPCNLYGPNDHFSPVNSHLIAAAILKVSKAQSENAQTIDIWGDGNARREFMYNEDLADFIISILPKLEDIPNYINVGPGHDFTVNEYYHMISEILGYNGQMVHDISKPIGMQRKLLDVTRLKQLNWFPKTDIKSGLKNTINWYKENYDILPPRN